MKGGECETSIFSPDELFFLCGFSRFFFFFATVDFRVCTPHRVLVGLFEGNKERQEASIRFNFSFFFPLSFFWERKGV